MSENKNGANNSLIQYTLYKHICFRPQLTLILVTAFVIFPFLGGGEYLFLQSTISTKERRKRAVYSHCTCTPSDLHEHSYDETNYRTCGARPIALVHVQSSDHLAI